MKSFHKMFAGIGSIAGLVVVIIFITFWSLINEWIKFGIRKLGLPTMTILIFAFLFLFMLTTGWTISKLVNRLIGRK